MGKPRTEEITKDIEEQNSTKKFAMKLCQNHCIEISNKLFYQIDLSLSSRFELRHMNNIHMAWYSELIAHTLNCNQTIRVYMRRICVQIFPLHTTYSTWFQFAANGRNQIHESFH